MSNDHSQYENQTKTDNKYPTPPRKQEKVIITSNQDNAERIFGFKKCLRAAVNSQFRTTAQGNKGWSYSLVN